MNSECFDQHNFKQPENVINFSPMFPFYTTWSLEMKQWAKMG